MRYLFLLLFTSLLLAQTKVTLALDWKYQFQFAGYIAALEKGFYKDADLDVEFLEYDGINAVDLLLNKKADFALSKSKVILDKMQGKELVLVANFFKKSALVFVTQSDIRSPVDFMNKSIMADYSEITASNLGMFLQRFKLTNNDYYLVSQNFKIDDFVNKNVDIMTAYVSNEIYQLEKMKYKYNIIDPINYGIFAYDANLVTTQSYANANPQKVRAFRGATIKGWKYALAHQEELTEIIYAKYSQVKSKEHLLFEAMETNKLIMPEVFEIGSISENVITSIAETFVELGLINKFYSLENFIFDAKEKNNHTTNKMLNLSAEEISYLKNKTIKMCIDPDWMPFEALVNGKYIGISADYFKILEEHLHKKIEVIQTSSWEESLAFGKERKCDIFSLLIDTPQRRSFLNFTQPYFSFPLVITTTNDKRFIANIDSIADKELSIVKGYAFMEILKQKYPNLKFKEVKNIEEGLLLVKHEKVFGHIDVLYSSAYAIEKDYITSLKINGKFDETWELGIGVRNDDPLLFSIFNKVSSLVSEAEKREILNRYLQVKYEQGFDYELLYKIAFVLAFFILFIIYRYILLSYKNKELQILQNELNQLNASLNTRIEKEIQKSIKKDKFLQEQSKLAAMGEMVGAIAHQWRQPLNSLNINIQNLDDDYADGLINKQFINNFIDKQSQTIMFMSKTIDDFRNFFRVDKTKEVFSIKDAITSTVNIQSAQLLNYNIKVQINGEDFDILGYRSEFQQVILNLITNAKDELVKDKITNASITITLSDKSIFIKDNAGGIPAKIKDRIFEPYFTTKTQGEGTGMGLYMSKMIIEKNMAAKLTLNTTEGGAEFKISF